jgi:cephalosporin hydroxylase
MGISSTIIEGSSISPDTKALLPDTSGRRVMVCLDSRHTADHVSKELELYADLVSVGCYLVVFDTFVDDMQTKLYEGKDCYPGNSPRQAVDAFLAKDDRFVIDARIDRLLQISSNHRGYLKKIKE